MIFYSTKYKSLLKLGLLCAGIIILGFWAYNRSVQSFLILWSWQREDTLTFLPPKSVVAPLVGTIYMHPERFEIQPRTNALKTPTDASLIPVIRLEIHPQTSQSKEALDLLVKAIVSLTHPDHYGALQIDFDAKRSQRGFYKELLKSLKALYPNLIISITALASWCTGDPWIEELPIEYAVPMVFNLGMEKEKIYRHLQHHKNWNAQICKGFIGMLQQDLWPLPHGSWHVFVFNNNPWSKEDYTALTRKI